MRVGMGLIKNEHGVFHVRKKVPKALEVATARVMGVSKERVSWLKETLGTKDPKQAKVLAKPVMMKFDRVLAQAEALLVEHPVRTELTEAEIKQISARIHLPPSEQRNGGFRDAKYSEGWRLRERHDGYPRFCGVREPILNTQGQPTAARKMRI
jgi:hypothetical protein